MSTPIRPKKKVVVNPITGKIEYVNDNNFSYENVPLGKKLTIQDNNQMTLHDGFEVDGDVDLLGSLILED